MPSVGCNSWWNWNKAVTLETQTPAKAAHLSNTCDTSSERGQIPHHITCCAVRHQTKGSTTGRTFLGVELSRVCPSNRDIQQGMRSKGMMSEMSLCSRLQGRWDIRAGFNVDEYGYYIAGVLILLRTQPP